MTRWLNHFHPLRRDRVYVSSFLPSQAIQWATAKSSVSQSRFGQEMPPRRVFPLFQADFGFAAPL